MPCRIAIGVGGQPGTATSTGITLRHAAAARVALAEDAAGAAAVADRDDELRIGRRVVGALQRDLHVRDTGPVTSSMSAWRGLATNRMPSPSML